MLLCRERLSENHKSARAAQLVKVLWVFKFLTSTLRKWHETQMDIRFASFTRKQQKVGSTAVVLGTYQSTS